MTWYFPFIFLGIGVLFGLIKLPGRTFVIVEQIGNVALIVLMLTIGISVGSDKVVIASIGTIGYQCVLIAMSAIFFSVLFVFLLEKTILPLDSLKEKLSDKQLHPDTEVEIDQESKSSPLVWIIPVSIILGAIAGLLFMPQNMLLLNDKIFLVSLAILYVTVGISLSQNLGVFRYVKSLGFKILLIPFAILMGSIVGGGLAGLVLNIEPHVSVMSASGMSYYSLTGAMMKQYYGILDGTYGFLVNVFREFLTVLMLPLLIKLGKGAPIAGGAAGCMDTMLVPISKFVGIELGFVALITGTILTFAVPILLPVLSQIL